MGEGKKERDNLEYKTQGKARILKLSSSGQQEIMGMGEVKPRRRPLGWKLAC